MGHVAWDASLGYVHWARKSAKVAWAEKGEAHEMIIPVDEVA